MNGLHIGARRAAIWPGYVESAADPAVRSVQIEVVYSIRTDSESAGHAMQLHSTVAASARRGARAPRIPMHTFSIDHTKGVTWSDQIVSERVP